MRPISPRTSMLAACAALATGLLGLAAPAAMAGQPARAAAGRWHVVTRLPHGSFSTVIAPSRTSAWAFGSQRGRSATYAVASHWNGRRWSPARDITRRKNSYVVCAGASSPRDVWAFIQAGGGEGNPPGSASALRLQNGRWVTERVWSGASGTYITGCDVLSPIDVWVFGGEIAGLGRGTGTWHLTQRGWKQIRTGKLVLFSASVVSARDLWAAGAILSASAVRPALAHWNGTRWIRDRSIGAVLPKSTHRGLLSVTAVNAISDRDIWAEAAVGDVSVVIVHWNGTRWRRVKPGWAGYYLPIAIRDGHGGWWSAPYDTPAHQVTRYLLHRARGRWTRFPLPGPLYTDTLRLARVPDSRAMLAAGSYRQAAGPLLADGALPK